MASVRARLLEPQRGALTLTGTGGSGKTRLALAVATDVLDWSGFPHGVWLVELAPLTDHLLVPGVVAASVGVKERSGRPIRDTLLDELRSRSLLVVLDNCEHLIEASAALAEDLLRNCPGVRILATSREPLRIRGERLWRVSPLPVPDAGVTSGVDELAKNPAVQLFVERAQAVQPRLTLTVETSQAIAGICARLDGLPLAIELAAARARVLTPEQILSRLDDTFRLLVGGSRTAPTRQQTLRATLDWSYQLLGSGERILFERLAVFAGGFDLNGVEAILLEEAGSRATEALDVLTGLIDRSLVIAQPDASGMRYRLLEPVRQYAQERLIERGAWEATRRQHAQYFLRLTEQAEEGLKGPDAHEWVARLQLNRDNVWAAARRCLDAQEPEIPLRLGSALRYFWQQFGYRDEGKRWLQEALALESEVPPVVRAKGLQALGVLLFSKGDFRSARVWFARAVEQFRELGDEADLCAALGRYGRTLASTAQTPLEYEQGKALMQESITLNRQAGRQWWTATVMMSLGISAWEHAELEVAINTLGEAEAILRQLGERHMRSHATLFLGGALRDQGDLVGSQRLLEESLAVSRELGCVGGTCQALYFMAGLTRLRGDPPGAARQALECLGLADQVSDLEMRVYCVELLGSLARERGLPEHAARLLCAAATFRQNSGVPLPPIFRPAYDRDLAALQATLGNDRFAAECADGSAMSIDQVVKYAGETCAALSQPAASSIDPLSQRERQVLALLAQGFTNRHIAEELIISGRTADAHVAHILAKLGLSTRAQAAVWAVEHPLLGTPI